MGVSTDGILAFGILLGDEDYPWGESDFEDWILSFYPETTLIKPPIPEDWRKKTPAEAAAWAEYWQSKRTLLAQINVGCVDYCSSDYPMYALTVKDSVIQCSRGYPTKLTPDQLQEMATQAESYSNTLKRFCERAKISGEPSWYLMSNMG